MLRKLELTRESTWISTQRMPFTSTDSITHQTGFCSTLTANFSLGWRGEICHRLVVISFFSIGAMAINGGQGDRQPRMQQSPSVMSKPTLTHQNPNTKRV